MKKKISLHLGQKGMEKKKKKEQGGHSTEKNKQNPNTYNFPHSLNN